MISPLRWLGIIQPEEFQPKIFESPFESWQQKTTILKKHPQQPQQPQQPQLINNLSGFTKPKLCLAMFLAFGSMPLASWASTKRNAWRGHGLLGRSNECQEVAGGISIKNYCGWLRNPAPP